MAELGDMIGELLKDEKNMEMIQSALASLTSAAPAETAPQNAGEEEMLRKILSVFKDGKGKEDDRCRLLGALRPFLGAARREKLDKSIGLLRALSVMEAMGGDFFV